MAHIISRHRGELPAELYDALGRYRHQVFIEALRWNVRSTSRLPGREFDQFDHEQTRYVLALDARQDLRGCARLLPTTRPYLLADVFGHLCDQPTPRTNEVWEISRFAADSSQDKALPMRVLWYGLHCAWTFGAQTVVAVTTRSLERYFLRHGVELRRLGAPQRQGRDDLVAISFTAFQPNGVAALRAADSLPPAGLLGTTPLAGESVVLPIDPLS